MTHDILTHDSPAPPAPRGDHPVKILVVTATLDAGGTESMSVALANALAADGLPVCFAAAIGPLRTTLDRRVAYLMTDDAGHAPIKTAHELSRYLRHHRPTVIHSHGAACAVVAAVAVKAGHASCLRVMTHHARGLRGVPRWIAGPIVRRCADHYLVVSPELKTDLEQLGVPGERISVVTSPADAGGQTGASEPVNGVQVALASVPVYRRLLAARGGET